MDERLVPGEAVKASELSGKMMADIYTEEELGPITVLGKAYSPRNGCVTIPTEKGDAIITLVKDRPSRRSWYYQMQFGKASYRYASLRHMEELLPKSLGLE